MRARWPIRVKWIATALMLATIVALLAFAAFSGAYGYRQLVRSISHRAAEIPQAGELMRHVDGMRFLLSQSASMPRWTDDVAYDLLMREQFRDHLRDARHCLEQYRQLLNSLEPTDSRIGDLRQEFAILERIESGLKRIEQQDGDDQWLLRRQAHVEALGPTVEDVAEAVRRLQGHLYTRLRDLQTTVRGQYRTWIILCWIASLAAAFLLVAMLWWVQRWVFRPLAILIHGSRRVAAGDFSHRIQVATEDEMAELAAALNAMTERFVEIRDDLHRQVRERTKEVVRSEQLASVGFLAAGVAHEINNPIGAIALAADGLEARFEEWLARGAVKLSEEEAATARRYLKLIQEEAFRCKEITEGLLDFSRLGHVERQPTDLSAIVRGVVEMVQHLGKYRAKNIQCRCTAQSRCLANPQELKQVVLNLLTNALDAVDEQGTVWVEVRDAGAVVELIVSDNGCGMTEEVLEHLFEPFFTRRRDGQGTGLGLSITYRIIQDHGGQITAHSDGPGKGSRFVVTLPKVQHETFKQGRRTTYESTPSAVCR
ncbi:MAG: ATPase [Pirellulaceae bacterium]|nr:MAG: ATPase [Pirellulaceae bacterium]